MNVVGRVDRNDWTMEVHEALAVLRLAHVALDDPLTAGELADVEERFRFTFAPDHAALLRACLPTGEAWPDWRHSTDECLQERLDSPVRGVLVDVSTNGFWPASWGSRPQDPKEALGVATVQLRRWPRLVPLYAHRFVAAGSRGRRVFSVHQTDVISYGEDLVDYLRREFHPFNEPPVSPDPDPIWPWSDLACGAEDGDL